MVLLQKGVPGTRRKIYSEDANDGTRTHNPSVITQMLQPLRWKAFARKELTFPVVVVYLYIFIIS